MTMEIVSKLFEIEILKKPENAGFFYCFSQIVLNFKKNIKIGVDKVKNECYTQVRCRGRRETAKIKLLKELKKLLTNSAQI